MSARHVLPVVLGLVGVAGISLLQMHKGMFDLFPLYYGAHELLESGDAYGQGPDYPDRGLATQVGNAYPLHAVILLGGPFSWIPSPYAGAAYVAIVGLAWLAAIYWAKESWYWLLWLPMWDALRMQQASAAIAVAGIVALGSLRRHNQLLFVSSRVVLSVKPQQTLFLLVALLLWGRKWWRSVALTAAVAAIVLWMVQPGWVARWIEQVHAYRDIAPGSWPASAPLLGVGLLMYYRGSRESGAAIMSGAAGPWPLASTYMAALWPLGLGRERSAGLALVSVLTGLVFVVLVPPFWFIPAALAIGTALVAILTRRPGR